MSPRTFRNAVAAVLVTAALAVAGTGCAGGGEPADRGAPAGAARPAPSQGTAAPEPERSSPEREKGQTKEAAGRPKVPRAELTPATGSFTGKQREYLVDRVPRGYEPAAVLEAGQAACQRLTRTVKVDRKAAVSALRSDEIAGAKDAVLHLCPKHRPLLQAAGLLD